MTNEAQSVNLFRIEGEYWTIAFDGQVCRLRDTKGLRYVAHLLAHPSTRVAAADLVAAARPRPRDEHHADHAADADNGSERERARVTVSKGIKAALQRIGNANPTLAEHLEVTIKRGYVCSYNPDPRVRIAWEVWLSPHPLSSVFLTRQVEEHSPEPLAAADGQGVQHKKGSS